MNSLLNHYETTMLSIWIHFLLRDFSLNSLSFSQIHYLFRKLSMNSLSASWFLFESTIYFVISLWIHYLFREFPMNSQSTSRYYYEFTILIAKSLCSHFLFRESTFNTLSDSRNISLISLSVSLIHYEIAIYFVKSLKSTIFPRINSEFIIYFANSIWIWR